MLYSIFACPLFNNKMYVTCSLNFFTAGINWFQYESSLTNIIMTKIFWTYNRMFLSYISFPPALLMNVSVLIGPGPPSIPPTTTANILTLGAKVTRSPAPTEVKPVMTGQKVDWVSGWVGGHFVWGFVPIAVVAPSDSFSLDIPSAV